MRSLKQIQEEYALDKHYVTWQTLIEHYAYWDQGKLFQAIDDTSKLFALEVGAESLKNACKDFSTKTKCDLVIRESILNLENLPKI